ncbi:MAG: SCO family protein [Chthoniobacteraceae bacterium]
MLIRRIIYLAVVVSAIAATWFQLTYQKRRPMETYKQVPDFHLTERSGKTVSLADLKGKVWVADFFYASCPGPCPVITNRLSGLQSEAFKSDDVRFVSISTLPDMDTPDVLKKYAEKFHASENQWLFLTGDKSQVYNLSNKGFMLTAVEQKDAEAPVIHSTQLALVDKSGNIRGYYDGTDDARTQQLLHDIKALIHE